MTRKQLQKQQAANRRLRKREQRKARLVREAIRRAKRKAKQQAKAAPKRSLAEWARQVRERAYSTCEICGADGGELRLNPDGTPKLSKKGKPLYVKLDAHHLLEKRYYPHLKADPMNGILLCPKCHSFGKYSAHKNAIWFVLVLKRKHSARYTWAKAHL